VLSPLARMISFWMLWLRIAFGRFDFFARSAGWGVALLFCCFAVLAFA